MKKRIVPVSLAALTLIFCLHGFQKKQQLLPPEKHEVEVRLIMVDVIVTKEGDFVQDLTKDHFELSEDGKRVPINSFELISFIEKELKLPEDTKRKESSTLPRKRLAVIFDAVNTWRREIKEGSEKIIDELVSLVKLGNEVMILQLSRRKGVEILQPFTTNEDLIKNSVEKASGNIWRLRTTVDSSYDAQTEIETRGASQTETDDDIKTGIEVIFENSYFEDRQRIDYLHIERQRFEKTIGGILAAFNMMKSFPGRKSILLISSGIPDLSPPDMLPNLLSGIPESGLASAYRTKVFGKMEDIKIFDPFNILDKRVFKNGEEVIRELIRFANAHNISIYSLDSSIFVKHLFSGASAEYYQKNEMTHFKFWEGDKIRKVQNLNWLSEDTGAESLRGANKYDEFRQVLRADLNSYYQLSFYPRRKEADNKYHKIQVKVKRRGVETRFRKGYTDYSKKETDKMLLVTAFYNPSLFKELPFKAEFIPFLTKSGKYEPWMNIALPAKELFRDRFVEYAPKIFNLHIWIKDKNSGGKRYGGKINIALNINPSFMDFIKNIDYLSYHFKGPEFNFSRGEYRSVFALFDPQTNEIGTWESSISFPDPKKGKKRVLINCVLGDATSNPKKGKRTFSISKTDGSLEFDQIKFFPKVTSQFKQWEGASVFMQIYFPHGKNEIQPEFLTIGDDKRLCPIAGELVAESWNKTLKVWSGIFKLDLITGALGESSLYVEIPESEEGAVLHKEMKLVILR